MPDQLVHLNRPLNLPQEAREQVQQIIASPQMLQYLMEHTISIMLANGVALNDSSITVDFMRGINRGTLLLLNSLIDHLPDEEYS